MRKTGEKVTRVEKIVNLKKLKFILNVRET